jgi:hypothetical protein
MLRSMSGHEDIVGIRSAPVMADLRCIVFSLYSFEPSAQTLGVHTQRLARVHVA